MVEVDEERPIVAGDLWSASDEKGFHCYVLVLSTHRTHAICAAYESVGTEDIDCLLQPGHELLRFTAFSSTVPDTWQFVRHFEIPAGFRPEPFFDAFERWKEGEFKFYRVDPATTDITEVDRSSASRLQHTCDMGIGAVTTIVSRLLEGDWRLPLVEDYDGAPSKMFVLDKCKRSKKYFTPTSGTADQNGVGEPRVRHFFYFPTRESLEAFLGSWFARRNKLAPLRVEADDFGSLPHTLITSVKNDRRGYWFMVMCDWVAKRYGGKYDGDDVAVG